MSEPLLVLTELRGRDAHLSGRGHRRGSALFDIFLRQCAGGLHALGTLVFRISQSGIGFGLLKRRGEPFHLRLEDGLIQLRQQLPGLHMVADLHIDRRNAARFPVGADGYVVARVDGAGEGHRGGHR